MYNVKILPFQTLILLKISGWESQCGSTHKISLKDLTMTWQIYRPSGSTSTTQPPLEKPWWWHADAERFPLNPLLNLENLEDNKTLVWPGKTEIDWRRLISKLSWLFDCSFINCHVVHAESQHLQLMNVRTVNFISVKVLLNPWVINNIFQSSKSMVVSHSST